MLARVGAGRLELTEAHRFAERAGARSAARCTGTCSRCYRGVLDGLRAAGPPGGSTASASTPGRSTTACSTPTGALLGNPVHYRDGRTDGVLDQGARRRSGGRACTRRPACSCCRSTRSSSWWRRPAARPARGGRPAAADPRPARVLAHRGRAAPSSPTPRPPSCSTCVRRDWSADLMARARDPAGSCSRRCANPATAIGDLAPSGVGRARAAGRCRSSRSGSHDTASAVVGVPARGERFAYISCGTWSLVGVELDRAGAHRGEPAGQLHQRGRRRRHGPLPAQRDGPVAAAGVPARLGRRSTWTTLLRAAADDAAVRRRRRPRRPGLPAARRHAGPHRARPAGGSGSRAPAEPGRDRAVHPGQPRPGAPPHGRATPQRLSGREVDVVHIVGGGARNELLCQLTADACGLPVRGRPGRGDRAGQRAGPGAQRSARSAAPWPTCGTCCARRTSCGATSRAPTRRPGARPRHGCSDRRRFTPTWPGGPGCRSGGHAGASAPVPGRRRPARTASPGTPSGCRRRGTAAPRPDAARRPG